MGPGRFNMIFSAFGREWSSGLAIRFRRPNLPQACLSHQLVLVRYRGNMRALVCCKRVIVAIKYKCDDLRVLKLSYFKHSYFILFLTFIINGIKIS